MATEQGHRLPRLLLVEDDPVSRSFLLAVLESLPAQVDGADSQAAALAAAAANGHQLWLIDANLPDGNGTELLQALRTRHPATPAIAHTADTGLDVRQRLLAAGFAQVLVKPLPPQEVLQAVRRWLAHDHGAAADRPMDWDETAALNALNGQRTHLDALRGLFMTELPGARDAVIAAFRQADNAAMRHQLHRLQASCGFVGAQRLGLAARQLHESPASATAMTAFENAIAALLDA